MSKLNFFLRYTIILLLAHEGLGFFKFFKQPYYDPTSSSEEKSEANNPCIDFNCGINSVCHVENDKPMCKCSEKYFSLSGKCWERKCTKELCGDAPCKIINNLPQCTCKYGGELPCRPECLTNTDCSEDKACIGGSCSDPCSSAKCEVDKEQCKVINHEATCECIFPLYYPDKSGQCVPNVCDEAKCGRFISCDKTKIPAVCTCAAKSGTPPNCPSICYSDSHCDSSEKCVNKKCVKLCSPGSCGTNEVCHVRNHAKECDCLSVYERDPVY